MIEARNIFRTEDIPNLFDRMAVDVPDLFRRCPLERSASWPGVAAEPMPIYRSRLLPFASRVAVWKLLHRLSLDRTWFATFQSYWSDVLGGRPLLGPEDFHFLRGMYRIRHRPNLVPDTEDAGVHTAAWQQPELLYQVFLQVYIESLAPKLEPAQWLRRLGARSFCEYGCATAPVTTAYRTFFDGGTRACLIDLPTIALHYAAFKFRRSTATEVRALDVEHNLLPPTDVRVDAIVCMQTFEHLLEPLAVAERFAAMLNPGGVLIFDYMIADGVGMDSAAGIRQRDVVLAFIEDRFELVSGNPRAQGSAVSVARLKGQPRSFR